MGIIGAFPGRDPKVHLAVLPYIFEVRGPGPVVDDQQGAVQKQGAEVCAEVIHGIRKREDDPLAGPAPGTRGRSRNAAPGPGSASTYRILRWNSRGTASPEGPAVAMKFSAMSLIEPDFVRPQDRLDVADRFQGNHLLGGHVVAKASRSPRRSGPSPGCPRSRSCRGVFIEVLLIVDQKGFDEQVAELQIMGDMRSLPGFESESIRAIPHRGHRSVLRSTRRCSATRN